MARFFLCPRLISHWMNLRRRRHPLALVLWPCLVVISVFSLIVLAACGTAIVMGYHLIWQLVARLGQRRQGIYVNADYRIIHPISMPVPESAAPPPS